MPDPFQICEKWAKAPGNPAWMLALLDHFSDPERGAFNLRLGYGPWELVQGADAATDWAAKHADATGMPDADDAAFDELVARAEGVLLAVLAQANAPVVH